MKHSILRSILLSTLALTILSMGAAQAEAASIPADEAIERVIAIGTVDLDGAKPEAVAVQYRYDITDAQVNTDTFALSGTVFASTDAVPQGENTPGEILRAYVNDSAEISPEGGSGTGTYVVLELATDYLFNAEQTFTSTLAVGVTQKAELTAADGTTIFPSDTMITNYTESEGGAGMSQNAQGGGHQGQGSGKGSGNRSGARGGQGGGGGMMGGRVSTTLKEGGFVIPDIAGFRFYTDDPGVYGADGPAFVGVNCFDEKDGSFYEELPVSYALFLPEDYREDGRYAMVVLDNPAAMEGTHPIQSVLETRSPAVYASEWAQNIVKEAHGLDGLIVVVPVVTARVDDNACSPAQYDALVQLWDHIQATYHVDPDYVYGSGQSVGGMVLLDTNRNRDNYFAGLMLYEDQWAQNYYKDTLFVRNMASDPAVAATAPFHYPRTNAELTWDYYLDTAGNPVYEGHDPNNYYYLISDDNILIMNRSSNNLSNDTWRELAFLYQDLTGYDFEQFFVDADDALDVQNEAIREYLARDNVLGLNWVTFDNGVNGYSCRKVDAGYEWLLRQSRKTEIGREKLDINRPFEPAEEQDRSDARKLHYVDADGNAIYFLTAKAGSGTQFYNTCWLNLTDIADAVPGWLPEGMRWETGVSGAHIESVIPIDEKSVAIRYDSDMTGAVIRLKGDPIIGLDGNVREDITIALNPYDLYDAEGNRLEIVISNVYVNAEPSVITGMNRGEGSGNCIILEFENPLAATPEKVVQRTTIRTNLVIASATTK